MNWLAPLPCLLHRACPALAVAAGMVAAAGGQELANHQLFVIRPDGTGLRQVTRQLDLRFGSPAISPDGKLIAADCAPARLTVQDTHLVVMNFDGSGLKHFGPGAMPAFSPNGRLIAYHTYGQRPAIGVMNADGSGREEIARRWGSPRWSPDGEQIIFTDPGGTLRRIELRTGREAAITTGRHGAAYVGFGVSRDGRRIAFGERAQLGLAIVTVDEAWRATDLSRHLPGSQFANGGYVATGVTFCSFSPDGTRLVFAMQTPEIGRSQVYVMEVEPPGTEVRLEGQDRGVANVNPQWSPDGEWIVFTSDVR